jgi:plastocyanin
MHKHLVLILALIPAAVAAAALPAAASGPHAQAAKTKKVTVGDLFFRKSSITINSGDTVRWRWTGIAPHDVTVTRGPRKFHSKIQKKGTYEKKLRKRGTYRYICTVHPKEMKGKIIVE